MDKKILKIDEALWLDTNAGLQSKWFKLNGAWPSINNFVLEWKTMEMILFLMDDKKRFYNHKRCNE